MKKRYVFAGWLIMCLLVLFVKPMGAYGAIGPAAPIAVHQPFKNFDAFNDSELPSFVREWAQRWRTTTNVAPHEVMKKTFDAWNYLDFHGSYDYRGLFDDGISFVVTVPERNGYQFKITLIEYQHRNGKILHIGKSGEKEIAPEDFQKIKALWANLVCEAADYHAKQFADSHFREDLIATIEAQLIDNGLLKKKGDLEKELAGKRMKISGVDFSVEKLLFIPSKSDLAFAAFAPKLVIIIPSTKIYGLSITESGIVMYNPYSLIELMIGTNDTVGHELFHRNKFFQGFLWISNFDVETWTSLSERIRYPWFKFLFHSYQESIRHAAKIITSFDAQRAKKEVFLWKSDAALAYDVSGALFDNYALKADDIAKRIKNEMLAKFPLAFYGNPIYWACVDEKFSDKNTATKTFLYSRFAFSLLGGPKKTQQWLDENEHVLLKAYKEVMEPQKGTADESAEDYTSAKLDQFNDEALLEVAKLLNLRIESKAELIRQIKALIEMGIISIPQIRTDLYLTPKPGEIGHVKKIQ